MKKIITILYILISFSCKAQDSTVIIITPQARDCELWTFFIYNDNISEPIYDSLKVKFRVQNPPSGNTTVSITGYTIDFINAFKRISGDQYAVKANTVSRIESLLRALNQAYLTSRLDAIVSGDTETIQTMRQFGRKKLQRQ